MTINTDILKRLLLPLLIAGLGWANKKFGLGFSAEELMVTSMAILAYILTGTSNTKAVAAAEAKAEEARGTVDTLHDAAQALRDAAGSMADVAKVQGQLVTQALESQGVKP